MADYLSEKEIATLDYYKKEYDNQKSSSFAVVQPKLNIEIIEDIPALFQSKGYLEIKKNDFGNNMELVSIILNDKFFEYFNISTNQRF